MTTTTMTKTATNTSCWLYEEPPVPQLKEEERVVGILKSLHQEKRIKDKADTPRRPALPGSGGTHQGKRRCTRTDRFPQPRVHKTSGDLNAVVSGDLPPST